MAKELKPLQALEKLTNYKCSCMSEKIECKEIVETALKRLEEIDNKSVCFVGRTRGQTKRIIEELSKHPEVKVTNLDDQKKLKALEIIIKYNIHKCSVIMATDSYKDYKICWVYDNTKMTEEEYKVLKEILI